jgi:hypothetical protein
VSGADVGGKEGAWAPWGTCGTICRPGRIVLLTMSMTLDSLQLIWMSFARSVEAGGCEECASVVARETGGEKAAREGSRPPIVEICAMIGAGRRRQRQQRRTAGQTAWLREIGRAGDLAQTAFWDQSATHLQEMQCHLFMSMEVAGTTRP